MGLIRADAHRSPFRESLAEVSVSCTQSSSGSLSVAYDAVFEFPPLPAICAELCGWVAAVSSSCQADHSDMHERLA